MKSKSKEFKIQMKNFQICTIVHIYQISFYGLRAYKALLNTRNLDSENIGRLI